MTSNEEEKPDLLQHLALNVGHAAQETKRRTKQQLLNEVIAAHIQKRRRQGWTERRIKRELR